MDFELSPELLKAIAPDANPKNTQIKFDDKGTLHVLERGNDGKLLKDYALKHTEEKIKQEQGNSKKEELLLKKEDNKESRYLYFGILLSVVLMLFECNYYVSSNGTVELGVLITVLAVTIVALILFVFCIGRLCYKYFKR